MNVKVDSVDNRGGGELGPESYGYVYFTDGTRVGYSPALPDTPPVWQPRTNGGGRYMEATAQHIEAAANELHCVGVLTTEQVDAVKYAWERC